MSVTLRKQDVINVVDCSNTLAQGLISADFDNPNLSVWNRELSQLEGLSLKLNPYQIFEKVKLREGGEISTLSGSISGIPDGRYLLTISNPKGQRILREWITFTNEEYDIYLPIKVGGEAYGYVSDNNKDTRQGAFLGGTTI